MLIKLVMMLVVSTVLGSNDVRGAGRVSEDVGSAGGARFCCWSEW